MKRKSLATLVLAISLLFASVQAQAFAFLPKTDWEINNLKANPGFGRFKLTKVTGTLAEKVAAFKKLKETNFFLTTSDGIYTNVVGVKKIHISENLIDA